MMKLSKLLKAHKVHDTPLGLPEVFGDSYLVEKNLVFRNIRNITFSLGYKFIPAWPQYYLMAEGELDTILKKKSVPFFENLKIYEDVERRRPDTFTFDTLPSKSKSYHFHESAHCVAEELFKNLDVKDTKRTILKIMMCESFANTVEAMSLTFATGQVHQEILMQNCYQFTNERKTAVRQRIIKTIGFESLFILTFYAFLYSNFLFLSLPKSEIKNIFRQVCPNVHLDAGLLKDIGTLFQMAFVLNPEFRIRTAQYFFEMRGLKGDITKRLDFDFNLILDQNRDLKSLLWKMATTVNRGRVITHISSERIAA